MRKIILTLVLLPITALAIFSESDKQQNVFRNLLRNPGFENGKLNWTASAGSFTITTTTANVSTGLASGIWDPSATSQTLTATAVAIPAGYYARSGLAFCSFKTTATDDKLQVTDGTNVINEMTIAPTSGYTKQVLNFVFPSSGNINLRVISASDSAAISIDECYIGEASNLAQVTQSQVFGGATYPATTNCTWTTSGTSYANYSADSDCTSPAGSNLRGFASAPATKVPGVTFSFLPPGKYHVVATGSFQKTTTTNQQCYWRIHDGTTAAIGFKNSASGANILNSSELIGDFEYTTAQSNITFQVQAAADAGTIACQVDASNTTYHSSGFSIQVYRFPSNAETVYKPDMLGWIVDANINGGNPSLGTSAVTSYTDLNDANLTLTRQSGSIPVGVACSTPASETQEVGDTTCTGSEGNESLGITFNAPTPGPVKACVSFAQNLSTGAGGNIQSIFELVETPSNALTVLQEGNSRIQGDLNIASASTTIPYPNLCGVFNFTSAGQKTIRLFYEQGVGGSISQSIVLADGNSGNGYRDVHFVVTPLSQSVPTPLIVNSVTMTGANVYREGLATLNCDGSSAITSQEGSWVSSIGNISSGACTVNFVSGTFSAAPRCQATSLTASSILFSGTASTSSVSIGCRTDAGANCTAVDFNLECVGQR